jgi:short/branched chain acyl-CoA dehydrogenase
MDYISYIIAVEEIARVDGSQAATIAAGNSLGIGPLYYFGNEEQKLKYLPQLCNGEALWGFGLTEPTAGSDAGGSPRPRRFATATSGSSTVPKFSLPTRPVT